MPNKGSIIVGLSAVLALLLAIPAVGNSEQVPGPIDRLVHEFVEAFNAGDYDVMASFYEEFASSSFKERRTEQESIALHQQLLEILGKISVQQIDAQGPEAVQLVVGRGDSQPAAEIRFRLVGDPPLIDGFSVGVDPNAHEGSERTDGDGHASGDADDRTGARPDGPFAFLESADGVHQSQVFVQSDGSLLLVWVQRGPHSLDLFAARQDGDGEFSHPTRLNLRGVNRYTGDEARPSVALGPDGRLAVAWTAANNDIMLATGEKYGEVFAPPLKLNQDSGEAYRTMPAVGMSRDGAAHVVWLDPREAPKGREEPSDLYYAKVKNGVVQESNLTARQKSTVCGCCRPFIAVDENGRMEIAFRNSTPTGYRDISRIVGEGGAFSEPRPTSPPIWKLGGCPSAGPFINHDGMLWKDGSTGDWRLLWSTEASATPDVLLSDGKVLVWTYSPRRVSGRDSWVLVGAKPHGVIMSRNGNSWNVVRDDLPPWVSSAAVQGGRLILVGNKDGRLQTSIRPL